MTSYYINMTLAPYLMIGAPLTKNYNQLEKLKSLHGPLQHRYDHFSLHLRDHIPLFLIRKARKSSEGRLSHVKVVTRQFYQILILSSTSTLMPQWWRITLTWVHLQLRKRQNHTSKLTHTTARTSAMNSAYETMLSSWTPSLISTTQRQRMTAGCRSGFATRKRSLWRSLRLVRWESWKVRAICIAS